MLLDRYASWHGCSTCILKTQVGGVHSHLISRVQRDKIRDGCSISRNDIMTTVFPMFQLYIEPHLVCAHVSEFEANLRLYHSITFDIRNILRILWYAHLYFFAEVSVLPWIMYTSNLSHDFSMENIVISSSICFYHMKTTTAAGTGALHCRLKDPKYRIWARRGYDNGLGFINFSIN